VPQDSSTLDEFTSNLEAVSRDVEAAFGNLNGEQLNWKPTPESWSIGQCLDHLIKTNLPYIPTIEAVKTSSWRPTLWQRMPVLPRMMGKLVAGAVSPQAARKLKSPGKFQPASSNVGADVVKTFLNTQRNLLDIMRSTASLDLTGIIISSPVASFVIYSLLDGYRIISNHEQRHLAQAQRVLNSPGFPAA
jgi:hypothetical protein